MGNPVPILLLLILGVNTFVCVISSSGGEHISGDKVEQCSKQDTSRKGPQNKNVFERKLVEAEPLAKDILAEHAAYHKDTSVRRFNGSVLGYVTPWSAHGYDVAKIFAKFDIISPVWLQIIKRDDEYQLAGTHDIDVGWIKDVRGETDNKDKRAVKILPRILFDKFSGNDFSLLLSYSQERDRVNKLVVDACLKYGFDGLVLEFWSQIAGLVDDVFLQKLIIEMANALKRKHLHLIVVIPPLRLNMKGGFGEKHLDALYKHVYAFSLMTYDYSSVHHPGPNAPIDWIRRTIENLAPDNCADLEIKRRKILMGLNMYGNDYTTDGGGSIVAHQYLELLKHHKKRLSFNEHDAENVFELRKGTGRHMVFYPTLYSINERIKLAEEMGVGISIWELGQGLDYFYDLF